MGDTEISAEQYFETTPPPTELEERTQQLAAFIQTHLNSKIAFVTSGGTTVPLEKNTVRFIDNFSGGTRGSISAEKFLEAGYAVVFFYRQHSLTPYHRKFEHGILDYVQLNGDKVEVKPEYQQKLTEVAKKYEAAIKEKKLLMLPFNTVQDYLFYLRNFSQQLSVLKKNVIFYLAAAVSDFYIPNSKMAVHKIQSSDGNLGLSLDKVPKLLKHLVQEWAPDAFVTTFKLETDENLLIKKSRSSLSSYGHQLVIANILNTRKVRVLFVDPQSSEEILLNEEEQSSGVEIEEKIIKKLVHLHQNFVETKDVKKIKLSN